MLHVFLQLVKGQAISLRSVAECLGGQFFAFFQLGRRLIHFSLPTTLGAQPQSMAGINPQGYQYYPTCDGNQHESPHGNWSPSMGNPIVIVRVLLLVGEYRHVLELVVRIGILEESSQAWHGAIWFVLYVQLSVVLLLFANYWLLSLL